MTKKQIKESSARYKRCYDTIYNSLPSWRQSAIKEDIAAKKNSGLLSDFIKLVIETAEREEMSAVTNTDKTAKKKYLDNIDKNQTLKKI